MKKIYILAALFITFGYSIFAQASVNLFDPFYEDCALWESIGIINKLSSIKPYPLQEIERILHVVIEKGTKEQVRRAKEYQKRFFNTTMHYGAKLTFDIKAPKNCINFGFAPFLSLNFKVNKFLTFAAQGGATLMRYPPKEEPLPAFYFSTKDIVKDGNALGGKVYLLPEINSSATIGTPEYYFSAGITRTSFGSFRENNILVGEQALHAGRFLFVINKSWLTYNHLFLTLTATNDRGTYPSPKKFLVAHSLAFYPLSWLKLELFELLMYGNRFEPVYLIPFSSLFIGQSLSQFSDNAFLGMAFTIKPLTGLKIEGVCLLDDIGVSKIFTEKNTRMRIAGQLGICYTMPKDHWFTMANLNYTMVMPYCYTHVDNALSAKTNYQNYTHNGQPLGSNLPPNSDRITLKVKFRPIYGLDIDVHNNFIRHGNISESITDTDILQEYLKKPYTTDGSILNHPTTTDIDSTNNKTIWKNHAFLYSTPFLKQETIQYINQLGLDLKIRWPILKSGGYMEGKIGYVFETNINPGVSRNIYDAEKGKKALKNGETVKNIAKEQLLAWRAAAKGTVFNHYIKIAAEFAY